jgi:hypothetical protein
VFDGGINSVDVLKHAGKKTSVKRDPQLAPGK